ncbi:MAG: tetratricopeptide repeat protein [Acidobacteriota bacterium]
MNDFSPDIQAILRAWVASTKDAKPPVPKTSVMRKLVANLKRTHLSLSSSSEIKSPSARDEALAVLSLLSFELVTVTKPSEAVLRQAISVFEMIDSLCWSEDEFDERNDFLVRFAFIAWRHSRSLGFGGLSQEWLEKYDSIGDSGSATSRLAADRRYAVDLVGVVDWSAELLSDPEQLFRMCSLLRQQRDASPKTVLANAESLYEVLQRRLPTRDVFDEERYFLCELATIAAATSRVLGRRRECASWLGAAQAACQGATDEMLRRAQCEYIRLSMQYTFKEFDGLATSVERLSQDCDRQGFDALASRSRYLKAVLRKDFGDLSEALKDLEELCAAVKPSDRLRPWALMTLAEVLAKLGRNRESLERLREAEAAASQQSQPIVLATLRNIFGEGLRDRGLVEAAAEKFREGIAAFASLGLATQVAYLRIILAESLLALGRPEEAELEILAALPTIEEQSMVPEGLSAIALLRESIRRRKTDRNALRELRERLQGKR